MKRGVMVVEQVEEEGELEDGEDPEVGEEEEEQRFDVQRRARGVVKVDDEEEEKEEEEEGEVEEEHDDEANADLSLQILEKAKKRRKVSTVPEMKDGNAVFAPLSGDVEHVVDGQGVSGNLVDQADGKKPLSRSETPEEGELQEDGDGNLVLAVDLIGTKDDERGRKKKKKKKEKKKKKKGGDNDQIKGKSERSHVQEVKLLDAEESMVMRKLLRGPRYFDPPEEQDQSCYNCGKVGHLAADCPEGQRQKPCYVCGTFGHEGRECPQKTNCYVCGKVGHIAKDCPNKGIRVAMNRESDTICLLCGRSGHEASTCYHSYDVHDLEQVQCYVCKQFGHLCCVEIIDTSPLPVSCFSCGEMGHTGAGCARPRRTGRDNRDRPASLCYKCGEEGHYARGCSKQQQRRNSWPAPWPTEEQSFNGTDLVTPSSKYAAGGKLPRWMDLQQQEGRWTPISRVTKSSDSRVGSKGRHLDAYYPAPGRAEDATYGDGKDQDTDSYMGPIENFVDSRKDGHKNGRTRSWTSRTGRRRS